MSILDKIAKNLKGFAKSRSKGNGNGYGSGNGRNRDDDLLVCLRILPADCRLKLERIYKEYARHNKEVLMRIEDVQARLETVKKEFDSVFDLLNRLLVSGNGSRKEVSLAFSSCRTVEERLKAGEAHVGKAVSLLDRAEQRFKKWFTAVARNTRLVDKEVVNYTGKDWFMDLKRANSVVTYVSHELEDIEKTLGELKSRFS